MTLKKRAGYPQLNTERTAKNFVPIDDSLIVPANSDKE
jgi:hypothetical protein